MSDVHFVEIMACPGGCLGGGGQPIPTSEEIRKKRAQAIYNEEESLPIRKSHENPHVKYIYEKFLTDGPCGELSHKLFILITQKEEDLFLSLKTCETKKQILVSSFFGHITLQCSGQNR